MIRLALLSGLFLAGGAMAEPALPPLILPAGYVPSYTCVREFHVAPAATNGDGSAAKPWNDISTANDSGVLKAGDCVTLADGIYPAKHDINLTRGGDRNAPDGYVVWRSATPHGAHIVAQSGVYHILFLQAPYLIIDGLDVDGNHAAAQGEAISTGGNARFHHLVVENNLVHDAGGGGIQLNDSEYFWVIGNRIWGNASTNTWQESGISTYQVQTAAPFTATPADTIPFHVVIAGNISRNNGETYACDKPGCHTDGNGIIIDKTLNVDRKGGVPYTGKILVANNLVYGNGGAGIHLYLSQHVTVANNTVYNNHLDLDNTGTWRGELSNADSDENIWVNNIGWAVTGPGVLSHNSPVLMATSGAHPIDKVMWTNNLTFGAAVDGKIDVSKNLIGIYPAVTDLNGGDFTLRSGSPAQGKGASEPYLTPATPDIGAY